MAVFNTMIIMQNNFLCFAVTLPLQIVCSLIRNIAAESGKGCCDRIASN